MSMASDVKLRLSTEVSFQSVIRHPLLALWVMKHPNQLPANNGRKEEDKAQQAPSGNTCQGKVKQRHQDQGTRPCYGAAAQRGLATPARRRGTISGSSALTRFLTRPQQPKSPAQRCLQVPPPPIWTPSGVVVLEFIATKSSQRCSLPGSCYWSRALRNTKKPPDRKAPSKKKSKRCLPAEDRLWYLQGALCILSSVAFDHGSWGIWQQQPTNNKQHTTQPTTNNNWNNWNNQLWCLGEYLKGQQNTVARTAGHWPSLVQVVPSAEIAVQIEVPWMRRGWMLLRSLEVWARLKLEVLGIK